MNTLKVAPRATGKKSELNRLRLEGRIPAIIYSQGKKGETVSVEGNAFGALLRGIPQGELSTTRFVLVDDQGKEMAVIVKGIEYHVTTYRILHLDFEELHDQVPVAIRVPIECLGAAECVGVKLGGALRQIIRSVHVRCLPKDIPQRFQLDVRQLNMRESLKLKDLTIPSGVRALDNLNEIAVLIVKR